MYSLAYWVTDRYYGVTMIDVVNLLVLILVIILLVRLIKNV